MTRATFFKHFELLADQPDAVAKMRELILELAVRGQLVSQAAKDEPASELLKRTEAEKARAVKAGEVRKQESLPRVKDDAPFDVPKGWEWTRLGNTGRIFNGNSVSESGKAELAKVEKGLPFIATKDVGYGRETFVYENGLRVPLNDPEFKVAHANAVLICAEGGSAGRKLGVTDRDICFGNKLYANEVWSGISHRWIFYVYQSPAFFKEFASRMTGIIGGIARSEFHLLPIPIPPENEQRRIVAKVDELMALCDELEQRQQARQQARGHLTQSAFHHLTAAADPAEFRHRFNFILQHSDFILDDVPQLRQAILSLAVQGRLVPTDNRRSKNGFDELPEGWRSVKLGEVADHRLGKMLDQQKNSGTPRPYLRNTNVHWFRFELDSIKELRLEDAELETYTLNRGDVLICEGGHGIGRTAVWSGEISDMVFQKALHRVRPGKTLDSHFFSFCMKVYAGTGILEKYFTGAGIPHFTGQSLAKMDFPLPPLAEQKRIVARVEELLRWCDTLEAQLHQTRTLGAHLLASTLHHLLAA